MQMNLQSLDKLGYTKEFLNKQKRCGRCQRVNSVGAIQGNNKLKDIHQEFDKSAIRILKGVPNNGHHLKKTSWCYDENGTGMKMITMMMTAEKKKSMKNVLNNAMGAFYGESNICHLYFCL
ncbi:hypothetical protein HELRODRAFT_175048 [Helobdella robusta]|uniref:Uncharacterized protein n=1 Tax=Helobdella robusta TaxID=6412 RepID=T1F8S2_HELRO|nr:hypothetical protein HELRODRAFT_175048 [Helobdella robusta]ESO01024.1 hypothetical protein HELRODRAFT_175048 [Helobdella robusta]